MRPASDVIARQLGESAVLIRMRTSRIYELNSTGARIWELLRNGTTREATADALAAEFQIEPVQAKQAVDELADVLQGEGLIA